jgi:hypothetical protein
MKSKPTAIEAITLRRAVIADTDKVRYRVYSTPTEFIAVIAESALMAVKVAGIRKPHKIVRDLPTEGVAIEAKKMAAIDTAAARIAMPIKQMDIPARLTADLQPLDPGMKEALFHPMRLGDLQPNNHNRLRILPPDLLHEIIEKHTKAALPPMPADEASAPAPPAPITHVQQEVSPKERLMELAEEVMPSPAASSAAEESLSPEDVEKLLNG